MSYTVKEIILTFQGEGSQTGRSAVFVRFSGCNMWSGREQDRDSGAGPCARWCDTDFVGGDRYSHNEIVAKADELFPWRGSNLHRFGGRLIVLTGGEPALQVDHKLLDALWSAGWEVAMETNGTIDLGRNSDLIRHLTVSPKRGAPMRQRLGQDLKVVVGHDDWTFDELNEIRRNSYFKTHILQPQDGPNRILAQAKCVEYARKDRGWNLGIQAHKVWGVP